MSDELPEGTPIVPVEAELAVPMECTPQYQTELGNSIHTECRCPVAHAELNDKPKREPQALTEALPLNRITLVSVR